MTSIRTDPSLVTFKPDTEETLVESGVSLYIILGHVEEEGVNLHDVTAAELERDTSEFLFNRVLE